MDRNLGAGSWHGAHYIRTPAAVIDHLDTPAAVHARLLLRALSAAHNSQQRTGAGMMPHLAHLHPCVNLGLLLEVLAQQISALAGPLGVDVPGAAAGMH